MPNVKSIINVYNKIISSFTTEENDQRKCYWELPLKSKFSGSSLVYKATIYIFKWNKLDFVNRLSMNSFARYRNSTTLSSEYWIIKDRNFTPSSSWNTVRYAPAYSVEAKKCQLCLCEKMEIANYPGSNWLKKWIEVMAKCRHCAKHKLFRNSADTANWRHDDT